MENAFAAAVSGIPGTAVMTIFVYVTAFLTRKELRVIHILGTMLTDWKNPVRSVKPSGLRLFVGTVCHFLVGVFFGYIYYLLWKNGIGKPDFRNSVIFGVINGFVAIGVWRVFFAVHPNPPAIQIIPYLRTIFYGHIFFSTTTVASFNLISSI